MTACSHGEPLSGTDADSRQQQADPNAMLAYEHSLSVQLPDQVGKRLEEAQEACRTARFGLCHILTVQQREQNASASLTVRILPAGVEPMIALARGEDGEVMRRETHAVDMADVVAENSRQMAQLESYAERLDALAKRSDISVADLISLAREQAEVQQKRDVLRQEGAQQQRRIDLHLLEIHFVEEGGENSFWKKVPELGEHFSQGVYEALRLTLYGFPFLIPLFFILLLWRWAWRWLIRRGAAICSNWLKRSVQNNPVE